MPTKIQWTDEAWNPVTGCTKISPGCANCYAERMAKRLAGRYGYPKGNPFQPGTYHEDVINKPLQWKKGRKIFVCSMGDLFHEDVPDWQIDNVFKRVLFDGIGHHTFQILTKRPERMAEYCNRDHVRPFLEDAGNVWGGVTVESHDQLWRLRHLLKCPFSVHFVSIEPMLGPIDFSKTVMREKEDCPDCGGDGKCYDNVLSRCYDSAGDRGLDWVICGGESGPGARSMKAEWVRSLRDQCQSAGVPFFFKQWGGANKKKSGRELDGQEHNEFPITKEARNDVQSRIA